MSKGLDVRTKAPDPRDAIKHTIAMIDSVHGDGNLPTIPVNKERKGTYGRYGAYWWGPGSQPDKITIAATSDGNPHPHLTMAHEVGHFLDHVGVPGQGFQTTAAQMLPEMADVLTAAVSTPTFQAIQNLSDRRYAGYLSTSKEVWARAYAQWVAWKSADPTLLAQVDADLNSSYDHTRVKQWPMNEFLPISEAIDTLFTKLGWLN